MAILNNFWVKRTLTYLPILFLIYNYKMWEAFYPSFDAPIIFRILGIAAFVFFVGGGLLLLFFDIRTAITKAKYVGCDHKGIYIQKKFIPWERIEGFKISRFDNLLYKDVFVLVNNQEEELQAVRNPIVRFFYRQRMKNYGSIHYISSELYNGSAEALVAHLESERKRYGKE